MKKLLLLFSILSLSLSSFAQSYRGMFDLAAGIITPGEKNYTYNGIPIEVKPFMGGVFSMTHGCQITPYLFAGLGAGINLGFAEFINDRDSYSNSKDIYVSTVPVFLDVRWDLDVRRKITPYVDLKIGYQIQFGTKDLCEDYCYDNYNTYNVYTYAASSFYFQPTVGVRFKGGKRSGFNLGIAYNAKLKRELYVNDMLLGSTNDGILMLNIGFDY